MVCEPLRQKGGHAMLVRPFSPHDVAFAASLSGLEGRSDTAQEYENLVHFDPHGCFIGEVDGEPVGMVLAISYGKLGWISALVVKQAYRGCGYGSMLLSTAVAYLLDHGARTVALDAPPECVDLYAHAGFAPAFDILYFRGQAQAPAEASHPSILAFRARDLHAVTMFDWACFGANRERVLRALLRLSPISLLAQDGAGVGGYLLARRTHDHWTVGPWVCTRLAEPLLDHALAAIGPEPVRLGVPSVNAGALGLVHARGLQEYYRETRMVQGDPEGVGHPESIYAVAASEKG